MESIVGMSTLAGKSAYERSSLPSEEQLNLHVEAPDFLALVRQIELEGELLEKLAIAAHEVFCDGLKKKGYRYGLQTNSRQKTHSSLIPYAELPDDEKEQNRLNVRDIANKLSHTRYLMRPARSHERPIKFPEDDLDTLSRMEHERWMNAKFSAGWQFAAKTDKAKKLHQALVPWEKLPKKEKDKDREMVRGIPRILAKAGYAVEKTG
jgi:RyR domain.